MIQLYEPLYLCISGEVFEAYKNHTLQYNSNHEEGGSMMNKKILLLLGVLVIVGGAVVLGNMNKEKAGSGTSQTQQEQPASKPESPTG